MFDVAIAGAGPAGATLARLIGRSYRVLLIDKRHFQEPSEGFACEKCCGGLLAPDAQRMLSKLGLGLPSSVLENPQLFVVKAVDIPGSLERYYQRHYINMNRQRFDCWLLSLVPPEVDTRTGCRLVSYAVRGASLELTLVQGGRTYTETAKILVGADGAASRVRRGLGSQCVPARRYFAVQEWVERDHSLPYFTSLFDREITDYYCWTIPKADHLIIGAALYPRRKTCEKFALLKKKLRGCGFAFGKTIRREGGFLLRPLGAAPARRFLKR